MTKQTVTIVGAGPGLGLAIARMFGKHDFRVALVSRNQEKLNALVKDLEAAGIEAAGFQADITDTQGISAAFKRIKAHFGLIDVLEFSPLDRGLAMVGPSEVTHENAQAQIDFYVHGAIAVVRAVLGDMLARGSGTILFTSGGSSVEPNPMMGNIGPASAWLRNWAHALHAEVAPDGVQVGHVAINAWIGQQPGATPEAIVPLYWDLHTHRDETERFFTVPA